ncbi:MAG: RNA methyltransferase [Opitutaceae bacterium]
MLTKAEIRRLRSLREKKHREAEGVFVVEGDKVIGELLAAGFHFEEVYATSSWPGSSTREVTALEMERISHFPTPSSALAVGRIARAPLAPGALAQGLSLALDCVQDPGNVGTLLRIADWFGLDRVLLSADCADLFSQKVINASMGSFARVTAHTVDLPVILATAGVPVFGCDLDGRDVHSMETRPVAAVIVIGSEGRGLTPAVRRCVTDFLTIPRFGGAESLNAAVAAAVVCDNLRRLG